MARKKCVHSEQYQKYLSPLSFAPLKESEALKRVGKLNSTEKEKQISQLFPH